jgi:hypothetical protein
MDLKHIPRNLQLIEKNGKTMDRLPVTKPITRASFDTQRTS